MKLTFELSTEEVCRALVEWLSRRDRMPAQGHYTTAALELSKDQKTLILKLEEK